MTSTVTQMRPGPNRIPPHNLDAEQSVLGSMLESKDAIANVVAILKSEEFYKPAHTEIFEAVIAVFNRADPVDGVTIAEELARRGSLEKVGGKPYIHGLLEAYPTASSAGRYATIVSENARLRRLITAGVEIQELGFSLPEDVSGALGQAEDLLFRVDTHRSTSDGVDHLSPLLAESMTMLEKLAESGSNVTGLATGFPDLDDMTAGLQPSNLVIIAARPSMGKSSLLNDLALHSAHRLAQPSVFFTLEMSKHEVVRRMLASDSKIDLMRLNKGQLQENDWTRLSGSIGRLAEAPLFIDDTPHLSVAEIRGKCRRVKSKHGLGLVVIDYLQLMQGVADERNREQEISKISRGLKVLARELEIPIVCAAQLNRGLEYRSDKHPVLADLRDSGALEQDADLVMFIYRDEVYNPDTESAGEAELIVAKHRNGPTGVVRLAFLKQYTKFASMARVGGGA